MTFIKRMVGRASHCVCGSGGGWGNGLTFPSIRVGTNVASPHGDGDSTLSCEEEVILLL